MVSASTRTSSRGWWKDTGKLEDILEANRLILESIETKISGMVDDLSQVEGKVVIEAGAKIVNSSIRGPAIIGPNTTVSNSYVGPFTSIYYGAAIDKSEIEHSIVLENSRISEVRRLEDSLIGKNVQIKRRTRSPPLTA